MPPGMTFSQYTSELGRLPVKSFRVYVCPTRGESRYGAYAMCHSVSLELVKDPAVLLIWSGLESSTEHQFYLIYIPKPTLYFYVRNQWENKILIKLLTLQEKNKRVQKNVVYIMHSSDIFSSGSFMR